MTIDDIDPQHIAAGLHTIEPSDRWTTAYVVTSRGEIYSAKDDGTDLAIDMIEAIRKHGRSATVRWFHRCEPIGTCRVDLDYLRDIATNGLARLTSHRW